MKDLKIVCWDLETLPDPREVYKVLPSYGSWPGRGFNGVTQSIMTFGFKINDERAQTVSVWDFPNWDVEGTRSRNNDAALVQFIYEMLVDADEIVTHNGRKFDLPVLNTRLLYYGLPALPKIPHADTKVLAKKASFYSKSLADIASFLELDNKMSFSNKWGMWERIAFGDYTSKDLATMDEYCRMDTEVLYQIYKRFISLHDSSSINKNVLNPKHPACTACGSNKLISNGRRFSGGVQFVRMQCMDCGAWSRKLKSGMISKL